MAICYLIGAGNFNTEISRSEGDMIIAADGGYDSLVSHGYVPDLVIGDLDSISEEPLDGIELLRFPTMKNETDMLLAYSEGARRGYTDFVILGGVGGRLDHTYANLSLLLYAKERGHNITVIDGDSIALCLKNESISLAGKPGDYFSVFAMEREAKGVTVRNAKYEANEITLTPSFPLGVSNEFVDKEAYIAVEDGALLVIAQ